MGPLWNSMETPWKLHETSMKPNYGTFMALYGNSIKLHGILWNSMEPPLKLNGTSIEPLWNFMELHGTSWNLHGTFMELHGNSMETS